MKLKHATKKHFYRVNGTTGKKTHTFLSARDFVKVVLNEKTPDEE